MKRIMFISIAMITFIWSCTEPYDVTLDSTHIRLVVQGSISDVRKAHQVSLTKSADYFSNRPADRVTGATLTISDGENIFYLTEISDGLYETDTMSGIFGKTYTLTIHTNGETYTSSCFMNLCPPIDSIHFGHYDFDENSMYKDTTIYVLLNALEPPTPNNYYLWNVYQNGILVSDTLHKVSFSSDIFVNGNYMYDEMVQWLESARVGDTVTLEMQSITKEYYDYIYQILDVTVWNSGPFGGPPANPKGNISNGAMGFFLAYSIESVTAIIPPKDEWVLLELY